MISIDEIKRKAERAYHKVLKAYLRDESLFPLPIRSDKNLSSDFAQMSKELAPLMAGSKDRKGFGYSVVSETIKTRSHGLQDMPKGIVFETQDDFLQFIGKHKEYLQFVVDCELIQSRVSEIPLLWMEKNATQIVRCGGEWENLIKVCHWFLHEFEPYRYYIRELPIAVHTKFIEGHKKVLKSLLEVLIPEQLNAEESDFEKRFKLKYDQPLIRYRFLDTTIQHSIPYIDLGVPLDQLAKTPLAYERIVIIENKMNYLTFPELDKAICIWGSGFAVENLKKIGWLQNKEIYYWSDLDVHGFQMLSQVRGYFKKIKAFLMTKEVLDAHNDFIVKGTLSPIENLGHLTSEESELYKYLQSENVRLEQERIGQGYILQKVEDTLK